MLKKTVLSTLILILSVVSAKSQEVDAKNDSVAVSSEKPVDFDSYYYSALNEKIKGNYKESAELLRMALRFKPDNADAQFELSQCYKTLKDFHGAILYGENAVRLDSGKKFYWLNLADLYSVVGDDENAERCYGKLVDIDPAFVPEYVKSIARAGNIPLAINKVDFFLEKNESDELIKLKRDLLVANKNYAEAIEITEVLMEKNPHDVGLYIDLSELYISESELDKAMECTEKGLSVSSENSMLIRQKFKILMLQSNFEEAFVILDDAFKNPKLDFNEKLGFVIDFVGADKDKKQTDNLISSLDNWVKESNEVRVYPIIGNLYKVKGENEKALEYFRLSFLNGYDEFSTLIEMLMLEQELGKYDLLMKDSDAMLKLYPDQPVIYLFKGLAANQFKEYDTSVEVLNEGLTYVENNDKLKAEFYSLIADGYYRKGEKEEAFKQYDKALAIDAENINVLNNYSFFLAQSGKQLDKALDMIKQVVAVEGTNATYLDTMSWVYFKRGEYKKAKEVSKKALSNGGDKSADILEHYGDILYKLNKVNAAVKQWKKANEIAGGSEVLRKKINSRKIIDENK